MPHFNFRNVNYAFNGLVAGIADRTIPTTRRPSRNGDVLQVEEPVIVSYAYPLERVLFNRSRDANPFFHLFEALWMLAGHNDVAPLAEYNSRIANYSDDGRIFNGAYGYRWRSAGRIIGLQDQLKSIIDHLKQNPESRRAVLQMWNMEDDLLKIDSSKDVCCNTHAYFALRDGKLDITVCNRSNDMIWGLLGANAVHFSFLLEYMAACIGVEVGVYHQITNNCHVYTERWEPEKWLAVREADRYDYDIKPFPLVQDPATFDEECQRFINDSSLTFKEPFLEQVAKPMCAAFRCHKRRQYDQAHVWLDAVAAKDWQLAGRNWILQRQHGWEEKSVPTST